MSETRVAWVTGCTGQDGSYLCELLVRKGYEVYGLVRPQDGRNLANLGGIMDKIHVVDGDLHDQGSLEAIVAAVKPDEVYNLAAQSHVGASFKMPELTMEVTGLGARRVFEAVRKCAPTAHIYQASSSEMFGLANETPQTEFTRFWPRSPYAVAKVYAHQMARHYREAYGMFISCGILFNHESERRPDTFVTRRITKAVARIHLGKQKKLTLGNVEARRDWGYAPDYVDLMWRSLQPRLSDDYIGATNTSHSVAEFAEAAFSNVGIHDWERYLEVDPTRGRPTDVPDLRGDYSKAKAQLDWQPRVSLAEIVDRMVTNDLRLEETTP